MREATIAEILDRHEIDMAQLEKGHEEERLNIERETRELFEKRQDEHEKEMIKSCWRVYDRIILAIKDQREEYIANGADRDALVLQRMIGQLWNDKPWVRREKARLGKGE